MLQVTNPHGVKFNVRLVKIGESYGRNDCLTADRPMIEFFDSRQSVAKFGPVGQFVSRYFVSTLAADSFRIMGSGLMLDGGVREWSVSAENMREVFSVLCPEILI